MNEPTGYTALDLIGYTDKGDYSPVATYVKNDLVNYGGTKWRCKVDDTTAVTPTEGVNWTAFVAIPADTTKQIIAPVEGATSLHAYAVGKQLIYNDTLYKVIAPIAVNDALVVDTNIEISPKTVIEQVEDNASEIDELWDAQQILGAWNLAQCIATDKTTNNVTYTVNSENIVTATWSSTPTGDANLTYTSVEILSPKLVVGKTYRVSGCPSGGAWGTGNKKYIVSVFNTTDGTFAAVDTGEGATFTPVAGKQYNLNVTIGINAGGSGTLTFEPMICLESDHNTGYAPYAMTNRELTEDKCDKLVKTLTSSDNLNDITETGIYRFTSLPQNAPAGCDTYGTLLVSSDAYAKQQIIMVSGTYGTMFVRSYRGAPSEWKPWYKFTGTVVS